MLTVNGTFRAAARFCSAEATPMQPSGAGHARCSGREGGCGVWWHAWGGDTGDRDRGGCGERAHGGGPRAGVRLGRVAARDHSSR